jgi:uncharacterized protein YeaO (DUF488 family)
VGDPVCYLHLLDEEGRMPEPRVKLERVYDLREMGGGPGRMVLVDRLWPRGIRKEEMGSARWLPALAPSNELREWFGHRPDRWEEFRRRYREELAQPERLRLLDELARSAREEPLTLLFGARDRSRNQAAVIAEALEERLT